MNSDLKNKIEARLIKVCPDTEDEFNDEFFKK